MAKATPVFAALSGARTHGTPRLRRRARPLDWLKRMSDMVAYALLVYTALQIIVTMHAMADGSTSMMPLFALVVLVGGIIPLFRHFERRWDGLSPFEAANPERAPLFRRDQLSVWLLAVGLPFVVTGLFRTGVALVG